MNHITHEEPDLLWLNMVLHINSRRKKTLFFANKHVNYFLSLTLLLLLKEEEVEQLKEVEVKEN